MKELIKQKGKISIWLAMVVRKFENKWKSSEEKKKRNGKKERLFSYFSRVKDFIDLKSKGWKSYFIFIYFHLLEWQGMKIDVHQVLLFLLDRGIA